MPTRASVEAAMLECHTWYADRYATRVDAAPSEIAAGSFAACGQQMDAFEALAPALAKQDAHVAIGVGDARAAEHRIGARFRKHVRNDTIAAVISSRPVGKHRLNDFDLKRDVWGMSIVDRLGRGGRPLI